MIVQIYFLVLAISIAALTAAVWLRYRRSHESAYRFLRYGGFPLALLMAVIAVAMPPRVTPSASDGFFNALAVLSAIVYVTVAFGSLDMEIWRMRRH